MSDSDDDPIRRNPEAVKEIAIRAFGRAKDAALAELRRRGIPIYGTTGDPAQEERSSVSLFSEDWIEAKLLDMLRVHCRAAGGLDSQGDPLRADLMRFCAENGSLEITGEFGHCVTASLTLDGLDLLARLDEEELRERKSGQ